MAYRELPKLRKLINGPLPNWSTGKPLKNCLSRCSSMNRIDKGRGERMDIEKLIYAKI